MQLTPRLVSLGVAVLLLVTGAGALAAKTIGREPIQVFIPAASPTPSEIKVYVSGAVQSPGVYLLRPADRLEDALRAAGGAASDALLERLNLAARLRDGDHVLVPRAGERLTPGSPGAPLLNLNTATLAELNALPGIGDVRARRIIESRERDGSYQDALELVERRIVPVSLYQQLKDLITAR